MKVFRIENIILQPVFVLAYDHDDAANIFGYSLVMGLGFRPDADFDVVRLKVKRGGPAKPMIEWAREGRRGMAWPVDELGGKCVPLPWKSLNRAHCAAQVNVHWAA